MGIQVTQPAFMWYQHPSLDEADRFLRDFGMVECGREAGRIYYRGVSSTGYVYIADEGEPRFVAGSFEVADVATLEEASQTIAGASDVKALPGPLGGHYVELRDPDGFLILLVAGWIPLQPLAETPSPVLNYGDRKQRFGEFQRFLDQPARVRKLGHYGFNVSNFSRTYAWYSENLGLLPSDTLHDGAEAGDIAAFMRVDQGDRYVDHHSIFFFQSPEIHVHHCSFEVQNPDEVMVGSEWLKKQGWKQFWGVGRHILGSQVFDYWRDPSGFMIEHYADGDIITEAHQAGRHHVADEALAVWGPSPPSDFLD